MICHSHSSSIGTIALQRQQEVFSDMAQMLSE